MICPKCKKEVKALTRDHILPKWFIRRMRSMQIKIPKNIKTYNYEYICSDCNCKKGGIIDFSHPVVRRSMRIFAKSILKKIEIYEKK